MTDPTRISDDQHNNAPAVPQGEPVAYIETITGRLCAPLDEHRLKFPMCYEPLCKQGTAPAQEPMQSFTVPDDLPGMWEHSDLTGGKTDCAKPAQEVGLTEGEIQALGHRIATTYRHDEDGFRRQYAFNIYTLVDFANAIIAALRAKGAV